MPIVLIVDAEPSQRSLVRAILSDDPSLIFLEASDDTQALDLAQLYHPDTIIFDLGGLSRKSQSPEQQQSDRVVGSIPVIFTATWSCTNRTLTTVLASGHPLLFKPFEATDLQAAVRHALKRHRLPARIS